MNGIFFTPGIFCYNYFGVFGKPQGLCVCFVTGHLTELALQLGGLLSLWLSLNVLFLCPFEAVAVFWFFFFEKLGGGDADLPSPLLVLTIIHK